MEIRKSMMIFLCVATAAACKDPIIPEENPGEENVTLNIPARINGSLTLWEEGDVIGAFIDEAEASPLAVTAQSKGANTNLTANASLLPGEHKFLSFYPKDAFDGAVEESIVKLNLPGNQSPTLDSFDHHADVMIGTPTNFTTEKGSASAEVQQVKYNPFMGGLEVVFEDLTGVSVLSEEKVVSVTLSAPGATLCGIMNCDLTRFKPNTWESEGHSINASYPESAGFVINGTNAAKLLVNPCTLESGAFTIQVETGSYSVEKTINESVKVSKGQISTLTVGITAADLGVTVDFSGGEGTEADPYKISKAADLKKLSDYINSEEHAASYKEKYYIQTEDISMAGENFTPIGISTTLNFRGHYDGAGHKITSLAMNNTTERPTALFGCVGTGGSIKGIRMESVDIKSTSYYTAAFVGYLYCGTISDCSFTGSVWSTGVSNNVCYAAGIAGRAFKSTIENCTCGGNVTTTSNHVGGVVGDADQCKIIGCKLSEGCAVHGNYYSGGIVGVATGDGSEIRDCVCDGQVSAQSWKAGGIASTIYQGIIENCLQTSKSYVSARLNDVGGICGSIVTASATGSEKKGIINNCAAYGEVHGQYDVGGICGYASAGNAGDEVVVSNCAYISGELVAQGKNSYNYALIGGLVGYFHGNGSAKCVNCYSAPSNISAIVTGTGGIAGLIGYQSTATAYVDNCFTSALAGDVLYENAPVSASSLSYWGSIIGRCSVAAPYVRCYYESSFRMGGKGSVEKATDCQGMSTNQMKDGTLLAALNAGTSQASGASGVSCSAWIKGQDNLPTLDGLPANPWPASAQKLRVSIIGDSISTFYGWMPSGYTAHYPNTNSCDVTSVDKTWWYRLIYNYLSNAKLDMNISFSNTTVTMNQDAANVGQYWYGHDFCSRFVECHGMGRPDVILIHGGTNDYGHNYGEELAPGIPMRSNDMPSSSVMAEFYQAADACTDNASAEALDYKCFTSAYIKLVRMMKVRYPDVKIVCIIGDSVTPGIQKVITDVASHYGAKVVDLLAIAGFRENTYVTKYDAGKVHPDANGMDYMARKIYTEHGAWMQGN